MTSGGAWGVSAGQKDRGLIPGPEVSAQPRLTPGAELDNPIGIPAGAPGALGASDHNHTP